MGLRGCQRTNIETIKNNITATNYTSRFNSGPKHWVDAQLECMAGDSDNCTVLNLINFNDNNGQNVLADFNSLITLQSSSSIQNFFNGSDWHIIFPILAEPNMSNELNFARSDNCIVDLVINPSDNTHYYLFKRLEENYTTLDFVIPTQQEQ